MFFLANKLLVLPVELIPNNDGMFQVIIHFKPPFCYTETNILLHSYFFIFSSFVWKSIGLDDIVGAMVLAVCFMRIRENDNGEI